MNSNPVKQQAYIWLVPCVEHEGDMESERSMLIDCGATIIRSYWNGCEDGEAWIKYFVPSMESFITKMCEEYQEVEENELIKCRL